MRIGILTVPFNNNYGGFLQAFALKKVLTDMGHEVIFISRRRNKRRIPLLKRILACPYYWLQEYRRAKHQTYLNQNTDKFKSKYLTPITEDYYTPKQLKNCLKYNLDAVVVGSDQVWRYRYAKDSIDDFYCNFLKGTNVKRLAYAASFGTDEQEYPADKLKVCSELIKDFSLITVREQGGKELLVKYFGVKEDKVQVILDPTLLLSVDDYKELFKHIEPPKEKYVFTYILDKNEDKQKLIDKVCKEKGLVEFSMSAQTGDTKNMKPIEPVELWLSRVYHADYVVTDSFHGTVFSILFNKPFVVYGNKQRGASRFESLLGMFGLNQQYVSSSNECISETLFDWVSINSIISKRRVESKNVLQ